ncbi:hydrogenase subunit MbhD domain-containing protein [Aminiphilus circumscriptus]|jgi:putative multicomponent Na+:H+ antiporter subunit B|uniref:hydrogenase subunit MbhD domain-containing protein n=1 Tax=Aminiphilus circumscriptus TaxID=290732 RepID=UPI00047864B0|nr:hydrogenase subunit MbhD domain-containing protein [Aminiphilus circumscriptus]
MKALLSLSGTDILVIACAALLPLMAFVTLRQERILAAVIARGMLGIAAALLYTLLGAPDVAVTEALMGALLVTLLYVVVFKRSGEFRVGCLELSPLVETLPGRGEEFDGLDVAFLRAFAAWAGYRPRFVRFDSREELLSELREGVVDIAAGGLVEGKDDLSGTVLFPLVETRILEGEGGVWIDLLRARQRLGAGGDVAVGMVERSSRYGILVSSSSHDLEEQLRRYCDGDGVEELRRLREQYLGGGPS